MRILIILMVILSFTGCSKTDSSPSSEDFDLNGYVIDLKSNALLIVWDVAEEELDNKTAGQILENVHPNAAWFTYKGAENKGIKVGDKVLIKTTGTLQESYPAQGVAVKVVLDH
ncbi:DUF3221 domain-containing protein [Paenibacillus sp. sgz500958]|uniref:DUF3221 domain-containing protein n=1 Tax=Paenibacillus sp. sgz500958 TaxID=3242475 RepID=UPI0036D3B761